MIPTPMGWSRQFSGGAVMLIPPGGHERGGVRYRERVPSLAPVRRLVERELADPAFEVDEIGPIEKLATLEGEHAALVTVRGRLDDRPAQRDIGYVFLDDGHAVVSGLAREPADFESFTRTVRELVRGDVHLAGERRRRFEYDCPAGWQGRTRGAQAEWYPLDYPRAAGVITVWPALPIGGTGGSAELLSLLVIEGLSSGWHEDHQHPPAFVVSEHGLKGSEWTLLGQVGLRATRRVIAILADDRYLYAARLESALPPDGAHEQAFHALVRSIRPVPRPMIGPRAVRPLFEQWVD